jgi:hypothetical protein
MGNNIVPDTAEHLLVEPAAQRIFELKYAEQADRQ